MSAIDIRMFAGFVSNGYDGLQKYIRGRDLRGKYALRATKLPSGPAFLLEPSSFHFFLFQWLHLLMLIEITILDFRFYFFNPSLNLFIDSENNSLTRSNTSNSWSDTLCELPKRSNERKRRAGEKINQSLTCKLSISYQKKERED